MLEQHTLDQLRGLRLDGMIAALNDGATQAAAEALPFEQRLALLVQREIDWRDGKRVARLLKAAKLKLSSACVEDIDWRAGRGLDRHLVTALAGGDWIRHGRNVLDPDRWIEAGWTYRGMGRHGSPRSVGSGW